MCLNIIEIYQLAMQVIGLLWSSSVCLGVFKNQGTTALGWVFKTQTSIQWVQWVEN